MGGKTSDDSFALFKSSFQGNKDKELEVFRKVFYGSPDPIILSLAESGRIVEVNQAFLAAFSFRREEVIGHTSIEIALYLNPKDRQELIDMLLAEGTVDAYAADLQGNRKQRGHFLLSADVIPIAEDLYIILIFQDITSIKLIEHELRESERLFRQLAENIEEAFWLRTDERMLYVSPAYQQIMGTGDEALSASPMNSMLPNIHPEDIAEVLQASQLAKEQKTIFDKEFRVIAANNEIKWIWAREFPIKNENGELVRWAGIGVDTTQRKQYEEKLLYLATTDMLTHISNRQYFFERSHEEFQRSKRYGHMVGLLILDIDHFKLINDKYGHLTGDHVLAGMVSVCASSVRITDLFGRIGGEEFALLLPESDIEATWDAAEKLRHRVEEYCHHEGDKDICITISVGYTVIRPEDNEFEDMVKRADVNLYHAKENGRNRADGDL